MLPLIKIFHSNLADALYYFEYHGPLNKRISWVERDKRILDLYKIIREIKFSMFKSFLPYARNIVADKEIDSPEKLAKFIIDNPPKGKYGEKWAEESKKMEDILQEIYNFFITQILSKEKQKEQEQIRNELIKKYTKIWGKLKEESEKLPGISWKRKEPKICLLYPLDGRLSHKLKISDISYIETSREVLNDETLFLHEIIKALNYSKPIGSWVKQDKRGIRAIAYEIFTELQTIKLTGALFDKKPNYKSVIDKKLNTIWIPTIRPNTFFDDGELERILQKAYKIITKHEFDALYQIGEIYTELNIILLA